MSHTLRRLDAGSWFDKRYAAERVPTLGEVLAVCRGKIDVLLDLKETGDDYARRVADVVKQHGEPSRTIVGVRSVEQAELFRKNAFPGEWIEVPDAEGKFAWKQKE